MIWKLSKCWCVLIILCFKYCTLSIGSRRLSLGERSDRDTRYMVYLLKSEKSTTMLDGWLCAGAIVSPTYILTSAACLRDVTYLYAIAGYRKYVRPENLNLDRCTRERKQKVIRTCVPKNWMYLDIGFAIVEKPYNFSDLTYRFYCSYVPTPIKINMDPKYVTIGTNAMVYGWGHILDKSEPYNLQDRNTEYLYSARTKITEKKVCYDAYGHENVTNIIMDYMICCKGRGLLNEYGNPDEADPEFADGRSRRNMKNSTNNFIKPSRNKNLYNGTNNLFYSRKQGICQNDHGTPLVTWIGREEYVLGVACTSLIRSTFKCLSPYLYTSTQCTSRFIRCAMLGYGQTPMRRMCDDLVKEEGYEIFETKIDWGQGDG
ncbi:uncharacterized protein LOC135083646 [Ostrinia nubilalis]|uniref:uncharacterized protein LOC135083646 n=1 Tax=Ostrinia nubilalis TaxID=29057 RepID=UPI0030825B8A